MFDIFDPFLAVWQSILTIAVHHPWAPLVVLMFFLAVEKLIDMRDKKKHPNE